jgi:succinylglutamate desuccinylase
MTNNSNIKLLNKIKKGEKPVVLVNACTHGNEQVGARIIEILNTISITHGTLVTNIANKKAFSKNKRFIDQDLNRVFPGNLSGNHEEKIAHNLNPLIFEADIVIDIHSTETGIRDSIIITKLDSHTQKIIHYISPKRVLLMSTSKGTALISSAKIGIAFEYGKDKSETTYQKTLKDIMSILAGLGMIDDRIHKKKQNTEYYKISKSFKKQQGSILQKNIKNFNLVRKGDVVAFDNNLKTIIAPCDFYPVLFGKNTYTEIFGFMGQKLDIK